MSRPPLIRCDQNYYCVTNRFLSLDEAIACISDDFLPYCAEKYQVHLESYFVTEDHLYILCKTPNKNLDQFIGYFRKKVSSILEESSWKGPYKWCLITEEKELRLVHKFFSGDLPEEEKQIVLKGIKKYIFNIEKRTQRRLERVMNLKNEK